MRYCNIQYLISKINIGLQNYFVPLYIIFTIILHYCFQASYQKPENVDPSDSQLVKENSPSSPKLGTESSDDLESEVVALREENQRLQEESQTAAQQLKRFTEWFFQTVQTDENTEVSTKEPDIQSPQ